MLMSVIPNKTNAINDIEKLIRIFFIPERFRNDKLLLFYELGKLEITRNEILNHS